MTEPDWLEGHDAQPMLEYALSRRELPDRKFRLLACAWCHGVVWDQIAEVTREVVRGTEDVLDGDRKGQNRRIVAIGPSILKDESLAATTARWTYVRNIRMACHKMQILALDVAWQIADREGTRFDPLQENRYQAHCLREIFGNLPATAYHRRPSQVPTEWLLANRGAVRAIVTALRKERRFDAMPVLADALEEAGCDDDAILAHCRQTKPHALGCWVMDLLWGAITGTEAFELS